MPDNDFNGDGLSDVLWRNLAGDLQYWSGQADGSFAYEPVFGVVSIPLDRHIVGIDDFMGHPGSDVLWRDGTGALDLWVGLPTEGLFGAGPSPLDVKY